METFSGIFSFIIFAIIIYSVVAGVKNRGIVNLALNNFKVDPEAEDQIIIEGRKTGLWQWVLVKLRLGNIYKIKVHKEYVSYSENSARGEILTLVPLKRIASTTCGYEKPIILLIMGAIFFLLGILTILISFTGEISVGVSILPLIVGVAFIFGYNYSKNFVITIESMGSQRFGFSFKKSVIENVPIEIDKIVDAIEIINALVINSDKKN